MANKESKRDISLKLKKKSRIMGKKSFSKHVNDVRVIAVPSRVIKDRKGNVVKQLYDIYQ